MVEVGHCVPEKSYDRPKLSDSSPGFEGFDPGGFCPAGEFPKLSLGLIRVWGLVWSVPVLVLFSWRFECITRLVLKFLREALLVYFLVMRSLMRLSGPPWLGGDEGLFFFWVSVNTGFFEVSTTIPRRLRVVLG